MNSLVLNESRTTRRPSALRRTAVGATGFLAGALPALWGLGSLLELVGGSQPDHRFHQVTGQGVLLAVLWLYGVVRIAVAGWRGRRPSASAALGHLAFVVATALTAAFVPGQGVVVVAVIVTVTGALQWIALPVRPRWGDLRVGLDPLLTPVALLGAALYVPFVLAQRTLQATAYDEHADMTHYFDVAWVCLALVVLGAVAATVPAARPLAVVCGVGTVVVGSARLLLTGETTWSTAAVALGVAGTALALVRMPRGRNAETAAGETTAADGVRA